MTHSEDGALFFYSSSLTSKPFSRMLRAGKQHPLCDDITAVDVSGIL